MTGTGTRRRGGIAVGVSCRRGIVIAISAVSAFACLLPLPVRASTYYASPTGGGSRCSISSRCSLATALTRLRGGDTLVLADGTYNNQVINKVPGGTPAAYTTIRAEHDGGAVIQSTSTSIVPLTLASSYVRLEGIRFIANIGGGSGLAAYIQGNHNKIFRCSFVTTPTLRFSAGNDVSSVVVSGSYNLLEDCWAWGGGRYKFLFYGGDGMGNGSYNILRRCVARHDRENSHMTRGSADIGNPQAPFCNYMASHNIFQNCIAIDNDQRSWYEGYYVGPWFLEKGQQGAREAIGAGVTIEDSIALNSEGPFVYDAGQYGDSSGINATGNILVSNSVAWSTSAGFIGAYNVWPGRTLTLHHSTLGNISGAYASAQGDNGAGFSAGCTAGNTNAKATNNIFYKITSNTHNSGTALINVMGANDYNFFYGNTVNRAGSRAGRHDIAGRKTAPSPLRYLTGVERHPGFVELERRGFDSGAIIFYQRGVSGSAYGEAGYNTLTRTPLWPWPNEERIKAEMSSYPSNWPVGREPKPERGFTHGKSRDGSSQTLTRYIWEYLGNTIPPEIYRHRSGAAGAAARAAAPF